MKRNMHMMIVAAGLVTAGGSAFAQDTATITQTAAMNEATISQVGNGGRNAAAITQDSPGNKASINQAGLDLEHENDASSAAITQSGDGGHTASIDQQDSSRVTATITQDGSGSQAVVTQSRADLASIVVTQTGINQFASLSQSIVVPTAGESGNFINLSQAGDHNATYFQQTGANAVADDLSQNGSFNYASVYQSALESFLSFSQDGDNNELAITQHSPASAASVSQTGSDNVASLAQDNSWMTGATIVQNGVGNVAHVEQDNGLSTRANLSQDGAGNFARIRQDAIESGATIVQASSNNFADIAQTGAGHFATIVQNTGDGNSAVIVQH